MGGEPNDRLRASIKGDAGRRERLAAELRENLKRRKAQARAIAGRDAVASPTPEATDATTTAPTATAGTGATDASGDRDA